jgi:FkbM family methyltransferase
MTFISNFLGLIGINCFSGLLERIEKIDDSPKVLIDGGAGLGETASKMLESTHSNSGQIIAFEPNPDNVKAFRVRDKRLTLVDQALSNNSGIAEFIISSKTNLDHQRRQNEYLQDGTSFVGKLVSKDGEVRSSNAELYPVRTNRLDLALAELQLNQANFIKLDLQGAETQALEGLGTLISTVHWMWIEFSNQPGLLEYLTSNGFILFDTEYLFVGRPNDLIHELFNVTRQGKNSIGKDIFFGYRRHVWRNYEKAFNFSFTKRRVIQTDLVAVSPLYLSIFLEAASDMIESNGDHSKWEIPRNLF